MVIEGISPREAYDEALDEDDDSSSDEDSDNEGVVRKGQTWRVGKGRVRLTEGGMTEYVGLVEKRIEKKMKALGMDSMMR